MGTGVSSRWGPWIASVVLLQSVLALRGVGPLDDDFIFQRYARVWLEHGELAFNLGQRVEGFVAPLWLALLALGQWLGLDPEGVSVGLGVAGALLAVGFSAALWRERHPQRAPIPGLFLASLPALAFHARSGLGTTLLAGCLAGFAWSLGRALRRDRDAYGAALWLGAATLLRPEALAFWLPFAALQCRRRRPGATCLALLPMLLWTGLRRVYFGTWLPHSFHAKRLDAWTDLGYGLEYLAGATLEVGMGLWLVACLVQLLPRVRRSEADGLFPVLAAGVALHAALVVAVGGDYMRFARFFVPALPLALPLTWHLLARWRAAGAAGARAALGVGVLLFLAPQASQHMRRGAGELYRDQESRWKQVGRVLAEATQEGESVAVSAIGCIGYYSGRPIVDMLGLTHRGFVDLAPDLGVSVKAHHRYDAEWVLAQRPHWVVPSNGELRAQQPHPFRWERDLLADPRFDERYRALSLPVPASYPLILYGRRDLPLPLGARELSAR